MGKTELIKRVSNSCGIHKHICEKVTDAILSNVIDALSKGENVSLPGFVILEVREKRERLARNPRTGEVETYPPVKYVFAKFSGTIKDIINHRKEI